MVNKLRSRKPLTPKNDNALYAWDDEDYKERISRMQVKVFRQNKKAANKLPKQPTNKQNDAPPKMVCFNDTANLAFTLHHSQYSNEEKRNCWYSKADYARAKRERQPILKFLKSNKENSAKQFYTKELCIRGLESHAPKQGLRKSCYRMIAWAAVLEEQLQQSRAAIKDPDKISMLYRAASKKCEQLARVNGILDEKAAEDVSNEFSPRIQNGNGVSGQLKRQKTPSVCRSSHMQFPKSSFPFSFLIQ
mmetsp:Transcript_27225/g.41176  ORF Transcript_27225/g.41176 Transcript_27225/m.41176 type:complete len:248 (-) Transcript_27225:244-987(-)